MGLFQKQAKQPHDDATDVAVEIFDDQYREELRAAGREQFKKVIEQNAEVFRQDLDVTIAHVGGELKDYMTTRLDTTIAHLDAELTKRLDERLAEYDKVTKDAQDQAVQSLNRNAQALHDKYEQLSQQLQQTIASQEAMMITTFEENKARIAATEEAQDDALQSLKDSAQASQQQSEQLSATLQKNITDQEMQLSSVFKENMERVAATKEAQEAALKTLTEGAASLKQQYDEMSTMLQKTVADQKARLIDVYENNMAQIIEHHLLNALGEQYDMKAQLPLIIKQMEENKQAIVDDMKL